MAGEHIVLAGDSIFDNANYVPGEPCVTKQLGLILGDSISVSMIAVDGDYAEDVHRQLTALPQSGTHIFVSAGGNDALRYANKLNQEYSTTQSLFREWANIQTEFRRDYHEMLRAILEKKRKTTVCTIYDAVPTIGELERTALSLFNDIIVAEAISNRLPVIDLRLVCTETHDYSSISPIEPSCQGGAKIVKILERVFIEHDFSRTNTVIYW